ncbi:RagB/SusD family nutrient uptake outer membrane protein [Hymenobacter endophyticus]|uniref:RagB/SusD family nutrient uptake outer membrane protein n=1 Tax=Hymenobacter endophyticus TaxID=3076335 RepID=A0ABU3TDC5_9BACT|nr:RagB/SusD family nutrient uptake outer membrane protein [Hymenobacter endophyticus]MDU0369350.1 RagB/SusD family nutrient uptake outer membrane protein [Hymenobacter endophyticus]
MNFSLTRLSPCLPVVARRGLALLLLSGLGLLGACQLDLPNPNAATDEQTLTTREGVFALSVGLRQLYSTAALEPIILTTGTSSREVKGITTFFNITELEQGGANLSPSNANTSALFARNYRVIGVADRLIEAAPTVLAADAAARSGVLAHAYLFKASALAGVALGFEQGPVTTGTAPSFVPRQQLLGQAISLLDQAVQELTATPPSTEFTTQVLGADFSLLNTVQAYRARFNLMAGNYAAALTAANQVTLTVRSGFTYSAQNPNPVYQFTALAGTNFRPRDRFGLPASLVEAGDGRLAFYLTGPVVVDANNGSTDNIRTLAGFFGTINSAIPAYLPDEMRLIRAEANLRAASPNTAAALLDINAVRTQASGDPWGVHANLPAYSGPVTVPDLLLEVYKQRSAELYLSGLRLDDSRRFGRPAPPTSLTERTRNFYPYPQQERVNNPNTPTDPSI